MNISKEGFKRVLTFNSSWGNEAANTKLRASHKSPDLNVADMENIFTDLSSMFERSPGKNVTTRWAKELESMGHSSDNLKQVCKSIPHKFEKFPTFNQIVELLRPYIAYKSESADALDELTHKNYFNLKAKFLKVTDEDTFNKMVAYYRHKNPHLNIFSLYYSELCMLLDWGRSYYGDGSKILAVSVATNKAADEKDREYFSRTLSNIDKQFNI